MAKDRNKCYLSSVTSNLSFILLIFIAGCTQEENIPKNPDEAIKSGWMFVSVSEFDRAELIFNKVAAEAAPGSREFLLARFGLGNAYQHRKPTPRYDEAKAVFAEIATQDKGSEIGGWSALALARIDHLQLYEVGRTLPAQSDLVSLQKKYQDVMDGFPDTPAADEAAVFYASSLVEQLRPESARQAVKFLNKWTAAHPKSSHLSPAYYQLAAAYENLGDRKSQLQALLKADETRVDLNPDGEKYFIIASVAERAGDNATAVKYYKKIIKEFSTDFRVFWCKRGIKRLSGTGAPPVSSQPDGLKQTESSAFTEAAKR